jgi:hypothetical protein
MRGSGVQSAPKKGAVAGKKTATKKGAKFGKPNKGDTDNEGSDGSGDDDHPPSNDSLSPPHPSHLPVALTQKHPETIWTWSCFALRLRVSHLNARLVRCFGAYRWSEAAKSKNTKKSNAEFVKQQRALVDAAREEAEAIKAAGNAHL